MTRIAIGALGGTIAMTSDGASGPVTPTLSAHDLVAAVPELTEIGEITAVTLAQAPSPHLTMVDLLAAYHFCLTQAEMGADGIVLTHGTDTLEETAYFLDLVWDRDIPIVLTGAMRAPSAPSADGPGNLVAAARAATCAELRGMGVLVAFDDEVHLARTVAKTHATATWTFASPGWGPVARLAEEITVMMRPARRLPALPVPGPQERRIAVLESTIADDGWAIEALAQSEPDGMILSSLGVGHLSVPARDAAERAVARGIPVVFASRTGSGPTLTRTYGYPGSEPDLLSRGLIGAGYLTARKARILLHVLLAVGASDLADAFAERGR